MFKNKHLQDNRASCPEDFTVGIIGGGIAGLAAATIATERGAKVHLFERQNFWGGRAGSYTDQLASGESFEMERGFHAFFRHYYNLRSLLARVNPGLTYLQATSDYPILGSEGMVQSFRGLPKKAPWNILYLTAKSPHLSWRDLSGIDVKRALAMMSFDATKTYQHFDDMTASEYLASLNFPAQARRMLFDVFAHSFFNPENEMSAAELLMMFHYYFVGNPEGLIFDVATKPYSTAFWQPLADRIAASGGTLHPNTSVLSLARGHGRNFALTTQHDVFECDAVIVATTALAAKQLLTDDSLFSLTQNGSAAFAPAQWDAWQTRIASLEHTHPFAVWRLWLDKPTNPDRVPFVGTTGVGQLDNISLYHRMEDQSIDWAERTGGSVVELHAYAVRPGFDQDELRRDLLAGLHALYPETASSNIVEDRFLWHNDCPAFSAKSHASRPTVKTPIPGLYLAGDYVALDVPSALMERAATSGMLAANSALESVSATPEILHFPPQRGLLAKFSNLSLKPS